MLLRRYAAAFLVFVFAFSVSYVVAQALGVEANKMCLRPVPDEQEYNSKEAWGKVFKKKNSKGETIDVFNLYGTKCSDTTAGKLTTGHCVAPEKCDADVTDGKPIEQVDAEDLCKSLVGCHPDDLKPKTQEGGPAPSIPQVPKPEDEPPLPGEKQPIPTTKPEPTFPYAPSEDDIKGDNPATKTTFGELAEKLIKEQGGTPSEISLEGFPKPQKDVEASSLFERMRGSIMHYLGGAPDPFSSPKPSSLAEQAMDEMGGAGMTKNAITGFDAIDSEGRSILGSEPKPIEPSWLEGAKSVWDDAKGEWKEFTKNASEAWDSVASRFGQTRSITLGGDAEATPSFVEQDGSSPVIGNVAPPEQKVVMTDEDPLDNPKVVVAELEPEPLSADSCGTDAICRAQVRMCGTNLACVEQAVEASKAPPSDADVKQAAVLDQKKAELDTVREKLNKKATEHDTLFKANCNAEGQCSSAAAVKQLKTMEKDIKDLQTEEKKAIVAYNKEHQSPDVFYATPIDLQNKPLTIPGTTEGGGVATALPDDKLNAAREGLLTDGSFESRFENLQRLGLTKDQIDERARQMISDYDIRTAGGKNYAPVLEDPKPLITAVSEVQQQYQAVQTVAAEQLQGATAAAERWAVENAPGYRSGFASRDLQEMTTNAALLRQELDGIPYSVNADGQRVYAPRDNFEVLDVARIQAQLGVVNNQIYESTGQILTDKYQSQVRAEFAAGSTPVAEGLNPDQIRGEVSTRQRAYVNAVADADDFLIAARNNGQAIVHVSEDGTRRLEFMSQAAQTQYEELVAKASRESNNIETAVDTYRNIPPATLAQFDADKAAARADAYEAAKKEAIQKVESAYNPLTNNCRFTCKITDANGNSISRSEYESNMNARIAEERAEAARLQARADFLKSDDPYARQVSQQLQALRASDQSERAMFATSHLDAYLKAGRDQAAYAGSSQFEPFENTMTYERNRMLHHQKQMDELLAGRDFNSDEKRAIRFAQNPNNMTDAELKQWVHNAEIAKLTAPKHWIQEWLPIVGTYGPMIRSLNEFSWMSGDVLPASEAIARATLSPDDISSRIAASGLSAGFSTVLFTGDLFLLSPLGTRAFGSAINAVGLEPAFAALGKGVSWAGERVAAVLPLDNVGKAAILGWADNAGVVGADAITGRIQALYPDYVAPDYIGMYAKTNSIASEVRGAAAVQFDGVGAGQVVARAGDDLGTGLVRNNDGSLTLKEGAAAGEVPTARIVTKEEIDAITDYVNAEAKLAASNRADFKAAGDDLRTAAAARESTEARIAAAQKEFDATRSAAFAAEDEAVQLAQKARLATLAENADGAAAFRAQAEAKAKEALEFQQRALQRKVELDSIVNEYKVAADGLIQRTESAIARLEKDYALARDRAFAAEKETYDLLSRAKATEDLGLSSSGTTLRQQAEAKANEALAHQQQAIERRRAYEQAVRDYEKGIDKMYWRNADVSDEVLTAEAKLARLGIEDLPGGRFRLNDGTEINPRFTSDASAAARVATNEATGTRGVVISEKNLTVVDGVAQESREFAKRSVEFFERVAAREPTVEGLAPAIRQLREAGLTPTGVGSEVRAMTAGERALARVSDAERIAAEIAGDSTKNLARQTGVTSIGAQSRTIGQTVSDAINGWRAGKLLEGGRAAPAVGRQSARTWGEATRDWLSNTVRATQVATQLMAPISEVGTALAKPAVAISQSVRTAESGVARLSLDTTFWTTSEVQSIVRISETQAGRVAEAVSGVSLSTRPHASFAYGSAQPKYTFTQTEAQLPTSLVPPTEGAVAVAPRPTTDIAPEIVSSGAPVVLNSGGPVAVVPSAPPVLAVETATAPVTLAVEPATPPVNTKPPVVVSSPAAPSPVQLREQQALQVLSDPAVRASAQNGAQKLFNMDPSAPALREAQAAELAKRGLQDSSTGLALKSFISNTSGYRTGADNVKATQDFNAQVAKIKGYTAAADPMKSWQGTVIENLRLTNAYQTNPMAVLAVLPTDVPTFAQTPPGLSSKKINELSAGEMTTHAQATADSINAVLQKIGIVPFNLNVVDNAGRGVHQPPSYRPTNQTATIDLQFFRWAQQNYVANSGLSTIDEAIAHEVGHHVMRALGVDTQITSKMGSLLITTGRDNMLRNRMEQMADATGAAVLTLAKVPINGQQVYDSALSAGDDVITLLGKGTFAMSDSTHGGTGVDRVRAFMSGLDGDLNKALNSMNDLAIVPNKTLDLGALAVTPVAPPAAVAPSEVRPAAPTEVRPAVPTDVAPPAAPAPSLGTRFSNFLNNFNPIVSSFATQPTVSPAQQAAAQGETCLGTSIALGFCNAAKLPSFAEQDIGANRVLSIAQSAPRSAFAGKRVYIAAVENSPGLTNSVLPKIIQVVREKGAAEIVLIGVGTKFDASVNTNIQNIAAQQNARFAPFAVSQYDGVHPNSYADLVKSVKASLPQTASQTGIATAPANPALTTMQPSLVPTAVVNSANVTLRDVAKMSGRFQIPGIPRTTYVGDAAFVDPSTLSQNQRPKNVVGHSTVSPAGTAERLATVHSGVTEAQREANAPNSRGTPFYVETNGVLFISLSELNFLKARHTRGGTRTDNLTIDNTQTAGLVSSLNSLGIEFAGNFPDVTTPLTEAQIRTGIALIRFLQERYGIPVQNIYAHSWIDLQDGRYHEGDLIARLARQANYVPGGPQSTLPVASLPVSTRVTQSIPGVKPPPVFAHTGKVTHPFIGVKPITADTAVLQAEPGPSPVQIALAPAVAAPTPVPVAQAPTPVPVAQVPTAQPAPQVSTAKKAEAQVKSAVAPGERAGFIANISDPATAKIVYAMYGIGGSVEDTMRAAGGIGQQFKNSNFNGVLIIPDIGNAPGRKGGGTAGRLGTTVGAQEFDAEMAAQIASFAGVSADTVSNMKRSVIFFSGGFEASNAMLLGLNNKIDSVQALDGLYGNAPLVLLDWMRSNPSGTLVSVCAVTCVANNQLAQMLQSSGIAVNTNVNAITKGATVANVGGSHFSTVTANSPVQKFLVATGPTTVASIASVASAPSQPTTAPAINPTAITGPLQGVPSVGPAQLATAQIVPQVPTPAQLAVPAPVNNRSGGGTAFPVDQRVITSAHQRFLLEYPASVFNTLRFNPVAYTRLQKIFYEEMVRQGRLAPTFNDINLFFAYQNAQVARESMLPHMAKWGRNGQGIYQMTSIASKEVGISHALVKSSDGFNMLAGMTLLNKNTISCKGDLACASRKFYGDVPVHTVDEIIDYVNSVTLGTRSFLTVLRNGGSQQASQPSRITPGTSVARDWANITVAQVAQRNQGGVISPTLAQTAPPQSAVVSAQPGTVVRPNPLPVNPTPGIDLGTLSINRTIPPVIAPVTVTPAPATPAQVAPPPIAEPAPASVPPIALPKKFEPPIPLQPVAEVPPIAVAPITPALKPGELNIVTFDKPIAVAPKAEPATPAATTPVQPVTVPAPAPATVAPQPVTAPQAPAPTPATPAQTAPPAVPAAETPPPKPVTRGPEAAQPTDVAATPPATEVVAPPESPALTAARQVVEKSEATVTDTSQKIAAAQSKIKTAGDLVTSLQKTQIPTTEQSIKAKNTEIEVTKAKISSMESALNFGTSIGTLNASSDLIAQAGKRAEAIKGKEALPDIKLGLAESVKFTNALYEIANAVGYDPARRDSIRASAKSISDQRSVMQKMIADYDNSFLLGAIGPGTELANKLPGMIRTLFEESKGVYALANAIKREEVAQSTGSALIESARGNLKSLEQSVQLLNRTLPKLKQDLTIAQKEVNTQKAALAKLQKDLKPQEAALVKAKAKFAELTPPVAIVKAASPEVISTTPPVATTPAPAPGAESAVAQPAAAPAAPAIKLALPPTFEPTTNVAATTPAPAVVAPEIAVTAPPVQTPAAPVIATEKTAALPPAQNGGESTSQAPTPEVLALDKQIAAEKQALNKITDTISSNENALSRARAIRTDIAAANTRVQNQVKAADEWNKKKDTLASLGSTVQFIELSKGVIEKMQEANTYAKDAKLQKTLVQLSKDRNAVAATAGGAHTTLKQTKNMLALMPYMSLETSVPAFLKSLEEARVYAIQAQEKYVKTAEQQQTALKASQALAEGKVTKLENDKKTLLARSQTAPPALPSPQATEIATKPPAPAQESSVSQPAAAPAAPAERLALPPDFKPPVQVATTPAPIPARPYTRNGVVVHSSGVPAATQRYTGRELAKLAYDLYFPENTTPEAALKLVPPRPAPLSETLSNQTDPLLKKSVRDLTDAEFRTIIKKTTESINAYLEKVFAENGGVYRPVEVVVVDSKKPLPKGTFAGSLFGPTKGKVQIDLDQMRKHGRNYFPARGVTVQATVAHEIGHYLQRLLGVNLMAIDNEIYRNVLPPLSEATSYDVRTLNELQADYLSARLMRGANLLRADDVENIYYSRASLGDDIMSFVAREQVSPFGDGHGSGAQRAKAFYEGINGSLEDGLAWLGTEPVWTRAELPWKELVMGTDLKKKLVLTPPVVIAEPTQTGSPPLLPTNGSTPGAFSVPQTGSAPILATPGVPNLFTTDTLPAPQIAPQTGVASTLPGNVEVRPSVVEIAPAIKVETPTEVSPGKVEKPAEVPVVENTPSEVVDDPPEEVVETGEPAQVPPAVVPPNPPNAPTPANSIDTGVPGREAVVPRTSVVDTRTEPLRGNGRIFDNTEGLGDGLLPNVFDGEQVGSLSQRSGIGPWLYGSILGLWSSVKDAAAQLFEPQDVQTLTAPSVVETGTKQPAEAGIEIVGAGEAAEPAATPPQTAPSTGVISAPPKALILVPARSPAAVPIDATALEVTETPPPPPSLLGPIVASPPAPAPQVKGPEKQGAEVPPPSTPPQTQPEVTPKPNETPPQPKGPSLSSFMSFLSGAVKGFTNSLRQRQLQQQIQKQIQDTQPVTVSITASPTTIASSSTSLITWNSKNATSCTVSSATGAQLASGPTNSSVRVGPLKTSTTYSVLCRGASGQAASGVVRVTVQ